MSQLLNKTNENEIKQKVIKLRSDLNDNDTDTDTDDEDDKSERIYLQSPRLSQYISPKATAVANHFNGYECTCYCIFIILFTISAILSRSSDSSNYRVTSQLKELLFTENIMDHGPVYSDIVLETQMWDYMQTILFPRLLIENSTSGSGQPINSQNNKYLVNTNNKLLGGIRLRSIRVESEACLVTNSLFPQCFPSEYKGTEVTDTIFGFYSFPNGILYRTHQQNEDSFPWIGIQDTYNGGGYTIDLPLSLANSSAIIDELRMNDFITRSTRAMFIDFNTYNPMVNIHTIARLAFEFPTSGGILASKDIKSWKILRYQGKTGTIIKFLEWILIFFVLYFTIEECFEMRRDGFKTYMSQKWNIADLINIIFFDLTIAVRAYEYYHRDVTKFTDTQHFESFRFIDSIFKIEVAFQMVNGFILVIKLLKYMTFSKRIRFLFAILSHSAQDLAIFSIVLMVLFGAFGFAGFLLFSSDVEAFRTYPHSILNLFRFLLGDVEYETLAESSIIYGSIFYCLWGVVMLLVLSNVFIAILTDSFGVVKQDLSDGEQSIFGNLFKGKPSFGSAKKKLQKWLGTGTTKANGGKGDELEKVFESADTNKDGRMSVIEIAAAAQVSNEVAERVMASYDVDGKGTLDKREFKMMQSDRENLEKMKEDEHESMHAVITVSPRDLQSIQMMESAVDETKKEIRQIKKDLDEIKQYLKKILMKGKEEKRKESITLPPNASKRSRLIASMLDSPN